MGATQGGRREIDKEGGKVSIRPEKERLVIFCADYPSDSSAFQNCLKKQTVNIFRIKWQGFEVDGSLKWPEAVVPYWTHEVKTSRCPP